MIQAARHSGSKRRFLRGLAAAGLSLATPEAVWARIRSELAAQIEGLPGKLGLRRLTHRPPNYETPLSAFRSVLTANRSFFVRYHHPLIPEVDPSTYRLEVTGAGVTQPLSLDLASLRTAFEVVEVVAVCQCSGNRRGLFQPPVPGLQWGHGAMGNARWRGVRLADVLARAGVKASAVEISIDAADAAPLEGTPDFVKSLPRLKALHPDTLLAFEMNGEPLPPSNGFPVRLVVPGWTATYWIKHVTRIEALETPASGFWMTTAYRLPRTLFPLVERFPSQESGERAPVTEIAVNSLITTPAEGERVRSSVVLEGLAWDAGHGVDRVEISFDRGASWRQAQLGDNLGRYSFRSWSLRLDDRPAGRCEIWARAANRIGQTQVEQAIANPAGYQHNAFHRIVCEVVS